MPSSATGGVARENASQPGCRTAIETGRYEPSLSLALTLSRLFGLTVEELFTLDGATGNGSGSA